MNGAILYFLLLLLVTILYGCTLTINDCTITTGDAANAPVTCDGRR